MVNVSTVANHTCFTTTLPHLPHGYKFDLSRPYQLVPFDTFAGHLEPIPICRRCYINASVTFDLLLINQLSARATVSAPEAVKMAGLGDYAHLVNSVSHPMYNELYPVVPREGRALAVIKSHYARAGTATRRPSLFYVVKYRIANDPRLSKWVMATEFDLRKYQEAGPLIFEYWYGENPHRINIPFIRSILTRLSPFANSAIWNKLPHDEAEVVYYLWKARRLSEWVAGMTMGKWKAREDHA